MWKLNNIYAKNLCAFKELDYTLEQEHTTLVFGNNMDNDSQVSNGSGKSALIEAIAIGLTGETLRKIKMDEIINDAENEAIVKLELNNAELGKSLIVSRTISRKSPQVISVEFVDKDGNAESIAQASVADYNKYVLEALGLSKDDVFSNFILSKHKYSSFLSSSDRDKKDLINRFSNGIMVDESIEALQHDMEPIAEELTQAELKVAGIKGGIDTLEEQIQNAINKSLENTSTKAQRIEEWTQSISNKRAYIREQKEQIMQLEQSLAKLDAVYNRISDLEGSDKPFDDCYDNIVAMFAPTNLKQISDYRENIAKANKKLATLQQSLKDEEAEVKRHDKDCAKQKKAHDKLVKEFEKFSASYDGDLKEITAKIDKLLASVKALGNANDALNKQYRTISSRVATIKNVLSGVITCPKCQHEFLLDSNADLSMLREELNDKDNELRNIDAEISSNQEKIDADTANGKKFREEQNDLIAKKSEWSAKVTESQSNVDSLVRKSSELSCDIASINSQIALVNNQIESARNDMFDEAYDIVDDETNKCENNKKQCETNIANAEGAIESYEESIRDIEHAAENDIVETLKESKVKREKELELSIKDKEQIKQKLAAYRKQEATFIEFKTHLANSKIEALSQMTNEFLEAINSDIRISFSGFTVLKSGKIRDKISISLIRDGVDCGSFDKFSEGEKARVNLANNLALHKLTNVNCQDGKGLDLLVLDEILEACDAAGLANMFNALNNLQITSLVVSHGNVAENYPYKLIINKKNDISYI